jgi:DMSO/TMAO reductase YedYZ molybdopterin-dependent catalytic subunit
MTTRGFTGRRRSVDLTPRIPPGQHLVDGFPVLSAGPVPNVSLDHWNLELKDDVRVIRKWSWLEFNNLPQTKITRDIHCVTSWSKLDTLWEGVMIDDLFLAAGIAPATSFLLAHSHDGYSTNIPVSDVVGGKAMVALRYDDHPLERDHGGPARLLVPHLYLWKSAKWIKGLQFTKRDEPGFWESNGYHMYGDPWREQRYTND